VRLGDQNGDIIARIDPTNTGSWNDFIQISIDLFIDVEGIHDLTFVGDGEALLARMQWFELKESSEFAP